MLIFEGTWNEWQFLDWAIIALAIVLLIVLTTILFKSPKANNQKSVDGENLLNKGNEDLVLEERPKQPKYQMAEAMPIKNDEDKQQEENEINVDEKPIVKPVVAMEKKSSPSKKATTPKKIEPKKQVVKKEEPKKVIVNETLVEEEDEIEDDINKPQIRNKYHISQNKDEEAEYAGYWRVRKEGSAKTIKFFKTQKEAIDYAEVLAVNQNGSIVIHKRDGTIRKQDYSKK